jgi:hypothetical protein
LVGSRRWKFDASHFFTSGCGDQGEIIAYLKAINRHFVDQELPLLRFDLLMDPEAIRTYDRRSTGLLTPWRGILRDGLRCLTQAEHFYSSDSL